MALTPSLLVLVRLPRVAAMGAIGQAATGALAGTAQAAEKLGQAATKAGSVSLSRLGASAQEAGKHLADAGHEADHFFESPGSVSLWTLGIASWKELPKSRRRSARPSRKG